jgi:hypothetical protein
MKKQTAVEWLEAEVIALENYSLKELRLLFNQAKAMEKDQIQDAYYHGIWVDESKVHSPYIAAEDYYTSTYES